MSSVIHSIQRIQVSSVLHRDVTEFGKQHLLDNNCHTCWNSDQGLPQWIAVMMTNPANIDLIQINFQGGFAGSRIEVWTRSALSNSEMQLWREFDGEDRSGAQLFRIDAMQIDKLKIVFTKSTDFFGRIIIYNLDLLSSAAPPC